MDRAILLTLLLLFAQARTASTGSVSGRIQSQDGTAAVGIRVTAVASGDGALTSATLTDNTGRYRLDGISPGRYFIAAGLIGSFTFLPGTTDESKATPVSVTANAVTENIDFKLAASAGVRIRGVVGMAAGNFPKAREATLNGRTINPDEAIDPVNTAVQPDGTFEFRGVQPGTYTVEFLPTAQEVRLTVGNTNIDDIKVTAPAVITGRILVEDRGPVLTSPVQVGAASTQLMIATLPIDSSGYTFHQVPGNGTFAFTLPAAHNYQVEVYGLPFGYFVKSIRSGTTDLKATALQLNDNSAVKNIEVVLTKQRPATEPAGVTVRGRVNSSTSTIPPGLQVIMTMTPALSISGTRVESDGTFVFHNVPPGPYTARVNNRGVILSKSVVVGDTDIDNVALTVSLPVTLNGRVRLENATPAGPRPALTLQFQRADGFGRRLAVNNSTFNANLLEGTYRITISDIPARFVLASVLYGSTDASFSVTLDPSKPAGELVITLRDRDTP
jgi:hypothetical protein